MNKLIRNSTAEFLTFTAQTGELDPTLVTEVFSVTAADGKNYNTKHYNLDAVISVGYRVNSVRAIT